MPRRRRGVGRAQRIHRGQPWPPGARRTTVPVRPGLRPGRQPEQRLARGDERMRPLAARPGRNGSRGHRHGRFDQARDARRRPGVADAGGDRAECRDGAVVPPTPPELRERGQFRRIHGRGPDTLPLDELNIRGIDPGPLVRLEQSRPGRSGRGGRRAPARDLRVDRHPRRPGIGRADQHHHAAALSGQQPGRVGRVHAHLAGAQGARPVLQRQPDRVESELGPAGHRQVELARLQGPGRRHHGVQRGHLRRAGEGPARGEPELLPDLIAQTRHAARDDQPGPAGPGHLAQPRVGQRQRGHLGGQLPYRPQVLRPEATCQGVVRRYLRDAPVIQHRRPQRAARQGGRRLEHGPPGHGEVMEFGGIPRAGEAAGHSDDRDGLAVIPPTVHSPPSPRMDSSVGIGAPASPVKGNDETR